MKNFVSLICVLSLLLMKEGRVWSQTPPDSTRIHNIFRLKRHIPFPPRFRTFVFVASFNSRYRIKTSDFDGSDIDWLTKKQVNFSVGLREEVYIFQNLNFGIGGEYFKTRGSFVSAYDFDGHSDLFGGAYLHTLETEFLNFPIYLKFKTKDFVKKNTTYFYVLIGYSLTYFLRAHKDVSLVVSGSSSGSIGSRRTKLYSKFVPNLSTKVGDGFWVGLGGNLAIKGSRLLVDIEVEYKEDLNLWQYQKVYYPFFSNPDYPDDDIAINTRGLLLKIGIGF